jgi:hypothetical protein
MADLSARLSLPLLAAGQAQKEITHNEALTKLDGLVHLAIEDRALATPPVSPLEGQSWIVPANAVGVWVGQAPKIAYWSGGGWRYQDPKAGFIAWSKTDARFGWFDGTNWQWQSWPVGSVRIGGANMLVAPRPVIANPAGGSVIDVQARDAVLAMLQVLRAHNLITT